MLTLAFSVKTNPSHADECQKSEIGFEHEAIAYRPIPLMDSLSAAMMILDLNPIKRYCHSEYSIMAKSPNTLSKFKTLLSSPQL